MHKHTLAERRTSARTAAKAFTLVELLVVIGIIGLLIGLLLPALGMALQRARVTSTIGTMDQFSNACNAYFTEFGEYPGVIPEDALEAGLSGSDSNAPPISGTENALLALMGGYRVPSDSDYASFPGTVLTFASTPPFTIKVDATSMGEGPWRSGKHYDSFFTPSNRTFGMAKGQWSGSTQEAAPLLPDLLDAWGQPIIYVRQARGIGNLVGTKTGAAGTGGQYSRAGILPYTLSTSLGELSSDQTVGSNPAAYSILNSDSAGGASGAQARDLTFGQLIRHPAQTTSAVGASEASKVHAGSARGKFILISAGPDGIFFSAAQGKGSPGAPQGDIVNSSTNPDGPKVGELYDDLLKAGGG